VADEVFGHRLRDLRWQALAIAALQEVTSVSNCPLFMQWWTSSVQHKEMAVCAAGSWWHYVAVIVPSSQEMAVLYNILLGILSGRDFVVKALLTVIEVTQVWSSLRPMWIIDGV